MVRCFLIVVIFLPSRETPVEIGFYLRKIRRYFACSDSYCLLGYKQDAALIVYKMWEVCNSSTLRRILHFADL